MITRVRLEATGESAAAVEKSLVDAGRALEQHLFAGPKRACVSEQVIERVKGVPDGPIAFKGRAILCPVIEGINWGGPYSISSASGMRISSSSNG